MLKSDKICIKCNLIKNLNDFVKNRNTCLECNRNYYNLKKYKKSKYRKNRMEIDLLFNIKENIRKNINGSFRRNNFSKTSKTAEILGCSYEEFKLYIENKFEIWMNWNNHGNYTGNYNETWQYDHIIPISSAKNEEEVIKLNHFTNLQPLCSKINQCDKKAKLDYNI